MPTSREEIEALLERRIADEELGSVDDLNAFPPDRIAEAARLPEDLRRYFLRMLAEHSSASFIGQFEEDVFDRGVPPHRWRRGGLLAPWYSAQELGALDVAQILMPIGGPALPWLRISPDPRLWQSYDPLTGAPALRRDDLTYRFRSPPHVMTVRPEGLATTPIDDVPVAVRRWVAARFAQEARRLGCSEQSHSGDELLRAIGVTEPSRDACISAAALVAEWQLPPASDAMSGFRGSDDWYRDPPAAHVPQG
jgi:hypothetical protein